VQSAIITAEITQPMWQILITQRAQSKQTASLVKQLSNTPTTAVKLAPCTLL
jgi:hypothetical protein